MDERVRRIAAKAWQHSTKEVWFPDPPPRDVVCDNCNWSMTYTEDSLGGFYICKVCGHVDGNPVVQDWD